MLHHRQRLPLRLKPRHDLPCVHAEFDDLESDPAMHRILLLRHPHDAEAALTDHFEQFVTPNAVTRLLRRNGVGRTHRLRGFHEIARALVGVQHRLHLVAQDRVLGARALDESSTLVRIGNLHRLCKNVFNSWVKFAHNLKL